MNRLIVKPMPQSAEMPHSCPRLAPFGRAAKPARSASRIEAMMATCLPTNSPAAMPSGKGASSAASPVSRRSTPALAKPKIGTIR